jgi:hypothetical protein
MKRPFDSDNKNSDSVSSNVSTWLTCLSYSLSLSQSTLSFLPQFGIEQQTYSLRRRLHPSVGSDSKVMLESHRQPPLVG